MDKFKTAYLRLISALETQQVNTSKLKTSLTNVELLQSISFLDSRYKEASKIISESPISELNSQIRESVIDMAASMLNPPEAKGCSLISTNDDRLHAKWDWPLYAKSTEEALAGVKDIVCSERIMLDAIDVTEQGIYFKEKGEVIMHLQPMPFEETYKPGRLQAEACFKNLQESQTYVASKRLSTLPGMSSLRFSRPIGTSDGNGQSLLPSIKTTVNIIKNFLKDQNIDIPLHAAQEVTAQFLIGHSWQVLIAAANKTDELCIFPPVMLSEGEYGNESKISYYRNCGDGVWAFCKEVEKKDLHPELHRAYMGIYKFYLQAAVEAKPTEFPDYYDDVLYNKLSNWEYVLNLTEIPEIDFDEDKVDEFVGVVGRDREVTAQHLRELFYSELKGAEKIRAFNKNGGEADFVRLKDWIFSTVETIEKPMLRVEKAGDDGLPAGKADYMAIYKGELEKTQEGVWQLKADYGRDLFLILESFTDEDANKLAEFSNIHSYSLEYRKPI